MQNDPLWLPDSLRPYWSQGGCSCCTKNLLVTKMVRNQAKLRLEYHWQRFTITTSTIIVTSHPWPLGGMTAWDCTFWCRPTMHAVGQMPSPTKLPQIRINTRRVGWLLEFHVLATPKVLSGQVPTCDNVYSWQIYSVAPTWYLTQPHYSDTEHTSHCSILIMLSTWLERSYK